MLRTALSSRGSAAPRLRAHPALLAILGALLAAVSGCAGQELARREGIAFPHSRLASFDEIPPGSAVYRSALAGALRCTGIPRERVASLPRVVRGRSFLVDPPYLGRTVPERGSVFVWDGTEVPLEEVLTHELIHWVLFQTGDPRGASDERNVERLLAGLARNEDYFEASGWYPAGDRAGMARWEEIDRESRRARLRRLPGYADAEPDGWGLAGGLGLVPRHGGL
jgi:hypothetical protein